jgi:hypothetical protein
MLRQMAEAKACTNRQVQDLLRLQKHVEDVAAVARHIEAMTAQYLSSFEKHVLQDRTWTYIEMMREEQNRIDAWVKRGQEDHMLISAILPKLGWYLSGQEPCTLSNRLAKSVREEKWGKVDQEIMEHLPRFSVDPLQAWLAQQGVPNHCINRLFRFFKHHDKGNYEEATYLGVPLLDEIANHLYGGKTFTTKRAKRRSRGQSKPELALKTPSGPDLENYCESFVQTFGSLQEDPQIALLANEDYWNRHAIVHGLMQRAMGIKDSAKCLMAISFLFFARKEEEITEESGIGN